MPAFHVESSVEIDASVDTVLPHLTDFEKWPAWSPWLYMERTAQLDYRGVAGTVGHGYDWSGTLVGAGGMTMTGQSPTRLDMDLNFLKPFKSRAAVRFDIESLAPEQTRVTWHMDGKLPFFLFFMTGMMKAMISMDYTRGLKLLKDIVETGTAHSDTVVNGVVDVPEQTFIGDTQNATLNTLADAMGRSYPQLFEALEAANLAVTGPAVAVYNTMDIKTGNCNYTAGLPIAADVADSDLPTGLNPGKIAAGKALKVTHTGSYSHLGNAWSTIMANQRHLKLKIQKNRPPFEVYGTDPTRTQESDLITEIYLPVK